MSSIRVNEVFFSVQGESSHMGRPCIFIRLTGCPLRCTYCDTEYAFFQGQNQSIEDVLHTISKYPCKLVQVTGGEPLAQKGSIELMERLLAKGYQVLLETSGALSIEHVPKNVRIIMDVKGPSSGELNRHLDENFQHLKPGMDEIKFVIQTEEDFNHCKHIVQTHNLFDHFTVLVSPSHEQLESHVLADWVLTSGLPLRMQVQMHKVIWPQIERGV